MTFVMSLACFSGCNLITTDSDKDMQQVVAEVSIDSGIKEQIYKQDLIIAYVNYGYNYVQSYGYTAEKTFNLILDNLISSRILVQNAMKELAEDNGITGADVFKIEKHLSEKETNEAKYNALLSVNNSLESFADKNAEDLKDTAYEEVRTTPTGATKAGDEVTYEEKLEYIEKYKTGITSKLDSSDADEVETHREAYNKLVNMLKVNNLLGKDYDGKDLTTSKYYELTLKQQYENSLLNKYDAIVQKELRAKVDFDDLAEEYLSMLNEQKEWDNEKFVQALEASSASEPVLFGVNGTYGHVYNLLLGTSIVQDTKIKAIDANLSIAEKEQARREILDGTTITDLRASWISAGYDFDVESKKFTGDYTFAVDPANSLEFKGSVRPADGLDDDKKEYSAVAETMSLTKFVEMMETYVYGSVQQGAPEYSTGSYYKGVKYDASVVEYKAKIQELLFAFSTDTGSLNNDFGYLIKPPVDGADNETYVKTFADAGRELLSLGGHSYVMVASDYGYHIMFFSEVYAIDKTIADTLVEYMNKKFDLDSEKYADWEAYHEDMLNNWADWEDTNNFLYILQNSLTSSKINSEMSDMQKATLNTYLYEKDGCVVKYEKAYADLIKE